WTCRTTQFSCNLDRARLVPISAGIIINATARVHRGARERGSVAARGAGAAGRACAARRRAHGRRRNVPVIKTWVSAFAQALAGLGCIDGRCWRSHPAGLWATDSLGL